MSIRRRLIKIKKIHQVAVQFSYANLVDFFFSPAAHLQTYHHASLSSLLKTELRK